MYKVIAESCDTRVILATRKPSQRDEWHSHPANTVVYALTDCEDLRIYLPGGTITSKECKAIFVERD